MGADVRHCMISQDIEVDANAEILSNAHDLFAATHVALTAGDDALGLAEEKDRSILTTLNILEILWGVYGASARDAINGGGVSGSTLQTIMSLNTPMFAQMNEAVSRIETNYSVASMHPAKSNILNISGRQRALNVIAAKAACFVSANMNPSAHREELLRVVALFETTMAGLEGTVEDSGLPAAPTPEIQQQLALVSELWAPLSEVYQNVINDGRPSESELIFISKQSAAVLSEMNTAVGMYGAP